MAVRSVGRTRCPVAAVCARLLGLVVVLGSAAMLAACGGAGPPRTGMSEAAAAAAPPRTGVSDAAAVAGVKKCRYFRVVRIKHGRRVHVRVKKCVRVRSKACKVTWSKQKRRGKVVIRKHNPVWVAKVSCPKAEKKTGGGGGPGGAGKFPLKVSSNGRFLETANNQPFLMVGDTNWGLIQNYSTRNAEAYLADRASQGFNALLATLTCVVYDSCTNSNGYAYNDSGDSYNLAPFTSGTDPTTYDISTPNSAYFAKAHAIVAQAKADGIEMILNPLSTDNCNTDSWMQMLRNNGNGTTGSSNADYQYGAYLGTTFADLNNVMWLSGNDFPCNTTTADNNDVLAVVNGIKSTDPGAFQTGEIGACPLSGYNCADSSGGSYSAETASWAAVVDLNGAYTYGPAYKTVRAAYGDPGTQPAFLLESNYEDGNFSPVIDTCVNIRDCRLQEWWTMTSGATGQLYGNWDCINMDNSSLNLTTCDSPAAAELKLQTDLLNTIHWQDLVPDSNGAGHLITSGGGTCPASGSIVAVDCVTAALTSDATLGLIYDPTGNTITVALSKMAAGKSTTARWFDPTNGTFSSIVGSPFADSGTHSFATPGTNSARDTDWVLVLQAP